MTETSEPRTERRHNPLNRAVAWVGVVAGVVFVVAVIFFSGLFIGMAMTSGHHHGGYRAFHHYHHQMGPTTTAPSTPRP